MSTSTITRANQVEETRQPKPLPAQYSDFYQFAETLPAEELAIVKRVRAYMETKVAPIVNKHWVKERSRWIMFFSCAATMPSINCRMMGKRVVKVQRTAKVWTFDYSMTR